MPNSLQSQFSNPCSEGTEALLIASARRRFEDLECIRNVLDLVDGLEVEARKVQALCDDLEDSSAETNERLQSPVLRGWLNRFSYISDWSASDAVLREQLALADNMRISFMDAHDWSADLAVLNGVCQTWDARLALGDLNETRVHAEKLGSQVRLTCGSRPDLKIDLADPSSEHILQRSGLRGTAIVVRNDLPLLKLKLRESEVPS